MVHSSVVTPDEEGNKESEWDDIFLDSKHIDYAATSNKDSHIQKELNLNKKKTNKLKYYLLKTFSVITCCCFTIDSVQYF